MDQDEVRDYVQRSQQLIETSPQMDEENTKVRLIQPFLQLLGWNLYSTEVELEYTVPMASGDTRVDYALLVGDSPAVFVEAKPARSSLSEREVTQLKSYMRQDLNVDWGIVTNGREFEVLTKGRNSGSNEEVSVARFNLEDLANSPRMLEILTKEAIRTGRADEIAEQVARTNEIIDFLSANEKQVAQHITESIENEAGSFPMDLGEQSHDFVQGLVSALREQRRFVRSSDGSSEDDPVIVDQPNPVSEPEVNRVAGRIPRSDIDGDPGAKVAVFPTKETGLPFLHENEAWGFVRIGQEFDYAAMYVTGSVREVRYIAEVKEVVSPEEADLRRSPSEYKDGAKIAEGKMVVVFEPGTLRELEDPVPFETKYPQGLRYTTLKRFKEAETTNDLF